MQSQAIYDFVNDNYSKKDKQYPALNEVLNELVKLLNTDYENSGNIRKWKRSI
jgi:hypothetical protein